MNSFKIFESERPEESQIIADGLRNHFKEETAARTQPLNVYAYNDQKLIGGIESVIVGKRLNIAMIWIDDAYRQQGLGSDLIQQIEQIAQTKNCDHALVDTMAFQAPEFYIKKGYKEVARLSGLYDHDRIFYRKELK